MEQMYAVTMTAIFVYKNTKSLCIPSTLVNVRLCLEIIKRFNSKSHTETIMMCSNSIKVDKMKSMQINEFKA